MARGTIRRYPKTTIEQKVRILAAHMGGADYRPEWFKDDHAWKLWADIVAAATV